MHKMLLRESDMTRTLSAATERGNTSTSMRTLFIGSLLMKIFSSMSVRNPDGLVMTVLALFLMASLGPEYDFPEDMLMLGHYEIKLSHLRGNVIRYIVVEHVSTTQSELMSYEPRGKHRNFMAGPTAITGKLSATPYMAVWFSSSSCSMDSSRTSSMPDMSTPAADSGEILEENPRLLSHEMQSVMSPKTECAVGLLEEHELMRTLGLKLFVVPQTGVSEVQGPECIGKSATEHFLVLQSTP